jgi:hypothetical protein
MVGVLSRLGNRTEQSVTNRYSEPPRFRASSCRSQADARHHSTQERRSATHWDSGAYTGVGHVSCGEGREPVLQQLVVHDECFLPEVAGA